MEWASNKVPYNWSELCLAGRWQVDSWLEESMAHFRRLTAICIHACKYYIHGSVKSNHKNTLLIARCYVIVPRARSADQIQSKAKHS